MHDCINLRRLNEVQTSILQKHLAVHNWYNHIPDEFDGISDFINKYAWCFREVFCRTACPYNKDCNVYNTLVSGVNNI